METADYRAFDELARQAHFGRAARRLGASPSALSRRIQNLEQSLGVELILRAPRAIELTPAGVRFLEFAREELLRTENIRLELAESMRDPEGELRIACTVTACYSVLPRLISAARAAYPKLSLQVFTQDAAQSFAQLETGEVDLAVVPTDKNLENDYTARPLGHAELIYIAPGNSTERSRLHPELDTLLEKQAGRAFSRRRIERLFRETPFVVQLAGLERKRLFSQLDEFGIQPRVAAEVRGNEGIIAMVALGAGLALVPDLVLDQSPAQFARLRGVPSPPGYTVSLCVKTRHLGRRNIRAFFELEDRETEMEKDRLSRSSRA